MAELAPTTKTPEYPGHVHEIASEDGMVVAHGSPYGAQIWDATVNGHSVILPLEKPHGIGNDDRGEGSNAFRQGETTKPGGSWVSFGGDLIRLGKQVLVDAPVHGPFGAAWRLWRTIKSEFNNRLAFTTGPYAGDTDHFLEDQSWGMERHIDAVASMSGAPAELRITNILTNHAAGTFITPKLVEHTYANGGGDLAAGDNTAVILASGEEVVRPEYIARAAPSNGNDIDTTLNTNQLGTPGECAFMPDGIDGHVVVIAATTTGPDGVPQPVEVFDIYRRDYGDQWTGVEPVMNPTLLESGQSVTMTVSIRTFETIDEYRAYKAAQIRPQQAV